MDPRLLLVEDEVFFAGAFQSFFGGRGFVVDHAESVQEAVAALGRCRYQVVIADLDPGSSRRDRALDVVQLARESQPEARIVVLTGYPTPSRDQAARTAGADLVLAKPVSLYTLAEILGDLA